MKIREGVHALSPLPRAADNHGGSSSLCPWGRHLMLFPTLGPSSLHVVVV